MNANEPKEHQDFIRQAVQRDRDAGKHGGRVHTRFPPEPNGYLHIGHAKSICLNFGIARQFGGKCNLRFDDTNPLAEEQEYVDAIMDDIRWLGFQWDELHFASDWFDRLWDDCVRLVKSGKAYVDQLDPRKLRELRGDWFQPGADSPYRDRPVEANLELLERMRKGEFADGEYVVRAKIDMAHPNTNLRDPAMYRIRHARHHRTGDRWCVYPMYDWAHGQNDSYEGITHSICTLEFEDHRPLYEWFIESLGIHAPQQIEFARLNLTYTVLSKRKLLQLVKEKLVDGWDDPRMPTIRGMRRRGVTPEALRAFCEHIGISKFNSVHEIELLEHFLRDDLNRICKRRLAVLDPIELVLTDWPTGKVDLVDALENPEDPSAGSRQVPFTGRLLVERDDFRDPAPKKWFRLAIGQEVRLRYGYFVTVHSIERDAQGNVVRLLATHDPRTRGGNSPEGKKVKGTIHWVAQEHAIDAEVRLYDRLFAVADPNDVPAGKDWKEFLNPNSLATRTVSKLEPSLAQAKPGERFQFERLGYFIADDRDGRPGALVFNRTVALKDSWSKLEKKLGPEE
ncbi:MAG: glutamine--tRNA ligase/YqeY domain fusion protein [Planctomycetes bacterium]|nr:glutamine--tRNA ligase/YqeY domain fusion protein [Planctomycetota bacterium]